MESITIRNLDDEVKKQLCIRATENGRSMEEEARTILCEAVTGETGDNGTVPVKGLGTAIHKLFKTVRRRGAGHPAARTDARAAQVRLSIIAAARRAAGRPIAEPDCQIAAIARSYGATVVTRNVPDFAGTGVAVINPWIGA